MPSGRWRTANQRLCDAEAADAQPAPDVATLCQVTRPSTTAEGQHAPGLRFGDARVMALMAAIVGFCHLITGFDNRPRQAHGLAARHGLHRPAGHLRSTPAAPQGTHRTIEGTHRYQLTSRPAVAVLFTKAYGRVLGPGLAPWTHSYPGPGTKPTRARLETTRQKLDRFIDRGLAAA